MTRILQTPGDAGRYVTVLPEEMLRQPEWQTGSPVTDDGGRGESAADVRPIA
jgi:hypothetical protein